MGWRGTSIALGLVVAVLASGSLARTAAASGTSDVQVSIDGPATVYTSALIEYVVTVGTAGPDSASNVVLTDVLPAGTVFDALDSDPCWKLNGATLTCTFSSMSPNAVSILLLALRAPSSPGTVTDTVTVSATESDPAPANNTASWSTSVVEPTTADIAIGLSPDPTTAFVGQSISDFMLVANNGPATATGVVATLDLPASLVYVASQSDGRCSQTAPGTVTCTIGSMPAQTVGALRITVQATAVGSLTETAGVTADQPDPNLSNNMAGALITVVGPASDLSAGLSVSQTPSQGGKATVTFVGTISNFGPSDAPATVATHSWTTTLKNLDVTSVTASQGTCRVGAGGEVRCQLGTLPAGAQATVAVTLTTWGTGELSDTFSASAGDPDPRPQDNWLTLTTIVS
jgi:uncharacterized repeat protein (TIGR01451 family)